jgi:uncharacterized membrane protein YraQ (UPF0718 family)
MSTRSVDKFILLRHIVHINIPITKRLIIFSIGLIALVASFWMGSRYPELDMKSAMAGSISPSSSLNFEEVFQIEDHFTYWKKVAYSTGNWLNTNKRGMTFGILFAALIVSFLQIVHFRRVRNPFLATLAGISIGSPLGVCVNCAAPISKGIYDSGARVEAALSTLISSPTLNVIVLTMLFSIFPLPLALIKLALVILTIFIIIPLLGKNHHHAYLEPGSTCPLPSQKIPEIEETWTEAIIGCFRNFASGLTYIAIRTVPLMLVAGFIGSAVIYLFPLEMLTDAKPTIPLLFGTAVVGVLLPVPIALDIVFSQTLLIAGIPLPFVMTLLFTLGIFSIYAFLIVWGSISKRIAIVLTVTFVFMGVGSGLVIDFYYDRAYAEGLQVLERLEDNLDESVDENTTSSLVDESSGMITENTKDPSKYELVGTENRIELHSLAHIEREQSDNKNFEYLEGPEIGLDSFHEFDLVDFLPPFFNGRSISAGDYDQDSFVDLVIGGKGKISLFKNMDGESFLRQDLNVGVDPETRFVNAAFVDLNGDSALDIYASTFEEGDFIIFGNEDLSGFSHPPEVVPATPGVTNAVAFADFDKDGDMDILQGKFYVGAATGFSHSRSFNWLLSNQNGSFQSKQLKERVHGETQSLLAADIDDDNITDLVVGNDFGPSNSFFRGGANGTFEELNTRDIPVSTRFSMSLDTADVNNDLRMDLFIVNISGSFVPTNVVDFPEPRPFGEYCADMSRKSDRKICQRNVEMKKFISVRMVNTQGLMRCDAHLEQRSTKEKLDCTSMTLMLLGLQTRDISHCEKISDTNSRERDICQTGLALYNESQAPKVVESAGERIPLARMKNVLLIRQSDGTMVDFAEKFKLDVSGWAWNTKFADLDNDGWQDVYVANGTWKRDNTIESNLFFRNVRGEVFEPDNTAGLVDNLVVNSFVYIDIENDGDLDIISLPLNSQPKVFVNHYAGENRSVTFEVLDQDGNHFGVGSKIFISTNPTGQYDQMREIKASGGFHSFDMPRAHFGLGTSVSVSRIKLVTLRGREVEFQGTFPANTHYKFVVQLDAALEL